MLWYSKLLSESFIMQQKHSRRLLAASPGRSRVRCSLERSRAARFAHPNRRACLRATLGGGTPVIL